ncbi:MAG: DUF5050 domain-containing protein [Dehalococcoidales bacterium]|nr:DUF5050 domain-containing protein [Dehalococcoidales bacterium]
MVRKCLLVGLAIILLVTLLGTVGCGKASISGSYVNQDDPDEYLELNDDGTFYLKEMGVGFDGEWEAEGKELRLHLMGMVTTAQIKGNKILDEDGKVWVKQRGAPTPPPQALKTSGKIVFVSERDGNPEIYVMNADGSNQTRLGSVNFCQWDPVWSPDSKKIAFVDWRDNNTDIYVMNADGTSQTQLTINSADDDTPSWSPDGKKILFVSERDANREIYVMNIDGTGQTRLTNDSADDYAPIWSPNGKKIAFVSERDGSQGRRSGEIYVMNLDGSNQIRCTTHGIDNSLSPKWAVWSPDSNRIAFLDSDREIYVMNPDGTAQMRLTTNGVQKECLAWSPDGKRITFSQCEDLEWIYIVNSDGSNLVRITQGGLPVWSPDGKKIVFCSFRDGNEEIYVMNTDGTGQTRLTNNSGDNFFPAWSPVK